MENLLYYIDLQNTRSLDDVFNLSNLSLLVLLPFSNNYSLTFDLYSIYIYRDLPLNSRALQTSLHIRSNQPLRTIPPGSDLNSSTIFAKYRRFIIQILNDVLCLISIKKYD